MWIRWPKAAAPLWGVQLPFRAVPAGPHGQWPGHQLLTIMSLQEGALVTRVQETQVHLTLHSTLHFEQTWTTWLLSMSIQM